MIYHKTGIIFNEWILDNNLDDRVISGPNEIPANFIELNNGVYTRVRFTKDTSTLDYIVELNEYGPSDSWDSDRWNIDNLTTDPVTSCNLFITADNELFYLFTCSVSDSSGNGILKLSSTDFSTDPQNINIESFAWKLTSTTNGIDRVRG